MNKETHQELFDYMDQEHGITLLETDMEEIEDIILKDYKERLKSKFKEKIRDMDRVRKYNGVLLSYILRTIEITL